MQLDVVGYTFEVDAGRVDVSPAELRRQVAAYARRERRDFAVDVDYPDSFTGRVMRAMAAIPYGETRTYGDLAADLGTSAVAVGGACGRNCLPVVVPCHRVVGHDSLGGFSSSGGVAAKRALLALERDEPRQRRLV